MESEALKSFDPIAHKVNAAIIRNEKVIHVRSKKKEAVFPFVEFNTFQSELRADLLREYSSIGPELSAIFKQIIAKLNSGHNYVLVQLRNRNIKIDGEIREAIVKQAKTK